MDLLRAMNLDVPIAVPIYLIAIVASRFAFRHRDCVAAAAPPAGPGAAPGRRRVWKRTMLCMLPLAIMQIAPCIEFMLRYKQWIRPPLPGGTIPATMIPGLLTFAAGTALAAVAARQLAAAWRSGPGRLCTSGLYSAMRHPMYVGYLLQGAGYALMLGSLWSWALYGPAVALIFMRIVVEDRELAGLFPEDFPPYRERVRRLVPFVF